MSDTTVGKGFIVYFSQLDQWSVAYFRSINWRWPKEFIRPIGTALRRVQENVTTDLPSTPIIEKISFGGELTVLDKEKRGQYKGRLFKAKSGHLIYSKIRIKQGSVCIVPSRFDWVAASSEYPIYEIIPDVVKPKYLELLLRGGAFQRYLDGLSHGGSSKTRIHPSQFEAINIPIPPLSIQEKIISYWDKLQSRLDKSANSIQEIEKILEVDLLEKIGIRVPPVVERKGGFLIRFIQTERWDTFFFREDFISIESQIISVDHVAIGDALNFVSRRWSKANSESDEFDYIEISSVNRVDGITSTKRVKVKEAPSRATTEVKGGDVIISTTRPNLGAFTVVDKKYEGSVCSSGFALADGVKTDRITKEFVLFFLKSPAGLRQIERRMSGGLYPAIIHSELEKVLIPLPSLNVQRKIVQEYQAGIGKIKKLQQETARDREKTLEDIDQMILGTLPVEE